MERRQFKMRETEINIEILKIKCRKKEKDIQKDGEKTIWMRGEIHN